MTSVPVLINAFNRPDYLADLIDQLRAVGPTRLYVVVDGPRHDVPGESDRVLSTRTQVERIDWDCRVMTWFREENLGCGVGGAEAVSWFLRHEEQGVVIEDDVRPRPELFAFAAELLDRYAEDDRVMAVCGCNTVPPEALGSQASYRFARVPTLWGWGTWRRVWSQYRYDLTGWRSKVPRGALWRASGRAPLTYAYWQGLLEVQSRGGIDTWDYQLVLQGFCSGGLTANSNANLVENVGFGQQATHTMRVPTYVRPLEPLRWPLRHPDEVAPDERAEAWVRRHQLGATVTGIPAQAGRYLRRRARR